MKTIQIKAGEKTRIIHKFSNSIPTSYTFFAVASHKADQVVGTVEVCGSNWLFPKAVHSQKLSSQNTVEKSMWDTFYSVYVTPQYDVSIAFADRPATSPFIVQLIFAIILFIVALSLGFLFI